MGSAFHQLCPRYSGTLIPTAPTAIRLWETFTFLMFATVVIDKGELNFLDIEPHSFLAIRKIVFWIRFFLRHISMSTHSSP